MCHRTSRPLCHHHPPYYVCVTVLPGPCVIITPLIMYVSPYFQAPVSSSPPLLCMCHPTSRPLCHPHPPSYVCVTLLPGPCVILTPLLMYVSPYFQAPVSSSPPFLCMCHPTSRPLCHPHP